MPKVLLVMPAYERTFMPTIRCCFQQKTDCAIDFYFPYTGYGDGTRDNRDVICDKYNAARDRFLAGDYDAMFTVESDMLIPEDALQKLWNVDADVAYGCYSFRRPPHDWNVYSVLCDDKLAGYPLSNLPDRARLDWGSVVDVDGIGLGCTLIRRHVLEAFPFRADGLRHMDDTRSHCDWYSALDWMNAGYTQKCDTSVLCGHISVTDRAGKVNPCIIWPDPYAEHMARFDPCGEPGTPYAELFD